MSNVVEELPPFGNPNSPRCRWCNARKASHNGGLICSTCDGILPEAGESK